MIWESTNLNYFLKITTHKTISMIIYCHGKNIDTWLHCSVSKNTCMMVHPNFGIVNVKRWNTDPFKFSCLNSLLVCKQLHLYCYNRKSKMNHFETPLKAHRSKKTRVWFFSVWLNVCTALHHTALGKIQYHTHGKYQTLPSMFPFVAGVHCMNKTHTSL